MPFTSSKKLPHNLRPITLERANILNENLIKQTLMFSNTNYIIGGGLSIPLMIRVYKKALDCKDEIINSWIPRYIENVVNGYYRDHNGIFHILSTEEELLGLVKKASEHNLTLAQRKREVTYLPGNKLEEYLKLSPEEAIKINKELLSSRALRLIDLNKKTPLFYCDVFIHHFEDNEGRRLNRNKENNQFIRECNKTSVNQEEVYVVSNKDEMVKVKLKHYQPLILKEENMITKIANPFYMFEVKKRCLEKRRAIQRDGADLEILEKILDFANIHPIQDTIEKLREGL